MTTIADAAAPAAAQTDDPAGGTSDDSTGDTADEPSAPDVDVLQVDGLFDDIIVEEIANAIDRAVENGSQALVLQTNSRGAVVGDDRMVELMRTIDEAPLPIGIWIGTGRAPRRSLIWRTTRSKLAPVRSILLMYAIRGTP